MRHHRNAGTTPGNGPADSHPEAPRPEGVHEVRSSCHHRPKPLPRQPPSADSPTDACARSTRHGLPDRPPARCVEWNPRASLRILRSREDVKTLRREDVGRTPLAAGSAPRGGTGRPGRRGGGPAPLPPPARACGGVLDRGPRRSCGKRHRLAITGGGDRHRRQLDRCPAHGDDGLHRKRARSPSTRNSVSSSRAPTGLPRSATAASTTCIAWPGRARRSSRETRRKPGTDDLSVFDRRGAHTAGTLLISRRFRPSDSGTAQDNRRSGVVSRPGDPIPCIGAIF